MFRYIFKKTRSSSLKKENKRKLQGVGQGNVCNVPLSSDLCKNLETIKGILHDSSDVTVHEFNFGHDRRSRGALVFINSLADKNEIQKNILQPLMFGSLLLSNDADMDFNSIESIRKNLVPIADTLIVALLSDLVGNLLAGAVILLIDGSKEALAVRVGKESPVQWMSPQRRLSYADPGKASSKTLM